MNVSKVEASVMNIILNSDYRIEEGKWFIVRVIPTGPSINNINTVFSKSKFPIKSICTIGHITFIIGNAPEAYSFQHLNNYYTRLFHEDCVCLVTEFEHEMEMFTYLMWHEYSFYQFSLQATNPEEITPQRLAFFTFEENLELAKDFVPPQTFLYKNEMEVLKIKFDAQEADDLIEMICR